MTVNIYKSGTERERERERIPACCTLKNKHSNKKINVTGYITYTSLKIISFNSISQKESLKVSKKPNIIFLADLLRPLTA
jgi:hypothetical protein